MFRNNRSFILAIIAFTFGVDVLGKDVLTKKSSSIHACDKFNKDLIPLPIDMEYESKNTALLIGINQIKYDFSLNLINENNHGNDVTFLNSLSTIFQQMNIRKFIVFWITRKISVNSMSKTTLHFSTESYLEIIA